MQLEEELDVVLFKREKRRIYLTNEGILLRRRAEEILNLVDKTKKELKEQDYLINGVISIGCGEVMAVQLLTKIMNSFKQKYPHITYKLYTGNAVYIKEQIDKSLIDVGMLLEPVNVDKYNYIRLNIKERFIVMMRLDDYLADREFIRPQDLIGKNIIIPWRTKVQNELKSWFGGYLSRVNIVINSNMSTSSSIMVQNGLGYSFVIEGSLPFLDKTKICYKPLCPEIASSNVLAWKKHQPFSVAATKFIEYVKAFLENNH